MCHGYGGWFLGFYRILFATLPLAIHVLALPQLEAKSVVHLDHVLPMNITRHF